jgi:translation initiation factor 2B subunit (eIF-2B alpha/beta/delta family)
VSRSTNLKKSHRSEKTVRTSANTIATAELALVSEHPVMVAVPSLVRCLGQSIAELGLGDLARMVPGGEYALKVAKLAWGRYRKLKNDQQIRDDVAVLARQSFDEAKQAAEQVAREVAGNAPGHGNFRACVAVARHAH